MRSFLLAATLLPLAGCAALGLKPTPKVAPTAAEPAVAAAPIPKPSGANAEVLDTTTAAQRAEAAQKPAGGEERLGTTIASLGDPTDPGFWIKTGLVSAQAEGRIEDPKTGRSAKVTLIPSGKPAGAGSEVSLPALRLLGVPLTELPELTVFKL